MFPLEMERASLAGVLDVGGDCQGEGYSVAASTFVLSIGFRFILRTTVWFFVLLGIVGLVSGVRFVNFVIPMLPAETL